MARLMAELEQPTLLHSLIQELARHTPFDNWLAVIFHKQAPPTILGQIGVERGEDTYGHGHYLLDPYYNAYLRGVLGCHPLRNLAPDDFAKTEYYNAYYRHFGLADEIGYLVALDARSAAHLSVCRTLSLSRFAARELAWFRAAEPVVATVLRQVCHKRRREQAGDARARGEFHARLSRALASFGADLLTEREREIVALMLKGHSAKSVARGLDIAPGTVRNHIKRIYAKLGVSSHSELFARFLDALGGAEPAAATS